MSTTPCNARVADVTCDLDAGHQGLHVNYGASVAWHAAAGPLGYVSQHPNLWRMLEALHKADWTEGECGYLKNIVEEQPDRTWGLELSKRSVTRSIGDDEDEILR